MNTEYKTIICKRCKGEFTANKYYAGKICSNCEYAISELKNKQNEHLAKMKLEFPELYY